MTEIYAAYGSNLCHAQMHSRCPGATAAGQAMLPGWRLVLRRFALLEADAAAACPLGLWAVSAEHLAALDRFEGPHAYERTRLPLPGGGSAWIYHEILWRPGPPAAGYVERLCQGYRDFGFDPAPLLAAIAGAHRPA